MSYNFPGSLDSGANLFNTRNTADTIPASDHNDLANVAIAVETKLGYTASTPTTVGNVLTVTAAGQSAWQAPAGGGGGGSSYTAFFNVKAYGAQGNGANDDTSSIQSAINAALATSRGTGTVYFPAGTYKITGTLNCSSATSSSSGKGVILRGDGHEASQIFKNSSFGPAVEWKGYQGPSFPSQFGGMRDITINGNVTTGGAIHVVAGQQMFFRGVSVLGSNDVSLDLDTTQDSYFSQMTFNNCGSTTKRVIEIYGSTYGTSNMLWFEQIRVETYLKGAVNIYAPSIQRASNGGNNGFFFSQCKFENYPTVAGDHFVADSYTQQVDLSQIFISCGNYNSGYSTPANGIVFGDGTSSPSNNQFAARGIYYNAGPTAGIGASAVKINGTNMNGAVTLDNIQGGSTFTNGVVDISNAGGLNIYATAIATNGTSAIISGDNSGHSARTGIGTFNGSGTVTISTKYVNTNSRIFITRTTSGTGVPYISAISSGTSFTVTSSNGTDAGTFNWEIRN
jgi:hypothetical protein